MCELLGISSKTPDDYKEILREFFKHSYFNPHGWGMMYMSDGEMKIARETVSANESEIIDDLICQLQKQKVLLAHIRYATVGSRRLENCHPFVRKDQSGRQWIMIHNGTVYSGNMINKYAKCQSGDTDSERILMCLMDAMNQAIDKNGGSLNEKQRFEVIDGFVGEISPRNKVNLMIYDGEILYAHKNMKNTLSFKRQNDGIILATKPLDDEGWIPLPMTRLLGFKAGKLIYQGTDHGNVFVSSLESITQYDAMHI